MRIGIDVDLTTVESDVAWWNWLLNMCFIKDEYLDCWVVNHSLHDFIQNLLDIRNEQISYNLAKYFEKPINDNVDPMDFWRNEGAYDTVRVRADAQQYITQLINDGHEIVFITHNKGNGSRSKYNLLARKFDKWNFAYVVTKEKYLVDVDVLIDDRHEFCNQMLHHGKHAALIETPYTQDVDLLVPYQPKGICTWAECQFKEVQNWAQFYQFIQDLESEHVG